MAEERGTSGGDVIRVMSFNVYMTTVTEAEVEHESQVWAKRAGLNVRTIKRYRPDVIGFQELDDGHLETYGEELAEYAHCVGDAHAEAVALGIFWRRERFALEEAGVFRTVLSPLAGEQDRAQRFPVATWARLRDRRSGLPVLFANTQLEDAAAGEARRREASSALLEQMPQVAAGCASILTGDFNCSVWSPAYRAFLRAGYVDTYRAAGNGDSVEAHTFHGFRGRDYFALEWGDQALWRVDWILSHDGDRRVQVTSSSIARDAEPPLYPSDHYPVVTEFMLVS